MDPGPGDGPVFLRFTHSNQQTVVSIQMAYELGDLRSA